MRGRYRAEMVLIAAVWGPGRGLRTDGGITVRRAVSDQGPYARGGPFDAFVVAPEALLRERLDGLGEKVWAWRGTSTSPRRDRPSVPSRWSR